VVESLPIYDITELPGTPRKFHQETHDSCVAFLSTFGQVEPILVSDANEVVWGMEYVYAMRDLGYEYVEALILPAEGWDEGRLMSLHLTLYSDAVSGKWDEGKLRDVVVWLDERDVDLTPTGLLRSEVRGLMKADAIVPDSDLRAAPSPEPPPQFAPSLIVGGERYSLQPDVAERLHQWGRMKIEGGMAKDDVVREFFDRLKGELVDIAGG